jgi:hypothetical protein
LYNNSYLIEKGEDLKMFKLIIDSQVVSFKDFQVVGEFNSLAEVNAFLKPIQDNEDHPLFEAPLAVIDTETGDMYAEVDLYDWEVYNNINDFE